MLVFLPFVPLSSLNLIPKAGFYISTCKASCFNNKHSVAAWWLLDVFVCKMTGKSKKREKARDLVVRGHMQCYLAKGIEISYWLERKTTQRQFITKAWLTR